MSTLLSNQYRGIARAGKIPALAIVFSAVFHAALLMGFNPPHVKVARSHQKDPDPGPRIEMTDLKDDPDPPDVPKALDDPPATPSVAVPTLPDVQVVTLTREFTQEVEPLPLTTDHPTDLVTIPTNIRHKPDPKEIPNVFNPADLDKRPEPISQPSPNFPYDLQHVVSEGSVVVGFIVDRHGDVVQARIISSSNSGFERAALSAIEKWKFRPGVKNGRKVGTRVEQPLAFLLKEDR